MNVVISDPKTGKARLFSFQIRRKFNMVFFKKCEILFC